MSRGGLRSSYILLHMYTVFGGAALLLPPHAEVAQLQTTWEDGAIYTLKNGSGMKVIGAALTRATRSHTHLTTPKTMDALESRCFGRRLYQILV